MARGVDCLRSCLRLLRPLLHLPLVGHAAKFFIGVFCVARPGSDGVETFSSALALVAALLLGFTSSQEAGVEYENLEAADARFAAGTYSCVTLDNSYGFFDTADRNAMISTQFAIESTTSIYALTASLLCTVTAMLSHASLRGVDPLARRSSDTHDELDAHDAHVRLWRWNRLLLMMAFALLLAGIVSWMNSIFVLRLVNFPVKRWERACAASSASVPSAFEFSSTPSGIWRRAWWQGFFPVLLLVALIAGTGIENAQSVENLIDKWLQQPSGTRQSEQKDDEKPSGAVVSAENLGTALAHIVDRSSTKTGEA